jgi:uncharacterized protein (TIGR03083 family)
MPESHAVAYRSLRDRVDELVRAADPETFDRIAPATPEWTVHDVVAHMVGVVDDVVHGRLEGVASDAWTAKQVDARRNVPVPEMLDAWRDQGPEFEALITDVPAEISGQALFDAITHEHDLRNAFGVPGARDSDAVAIAWDWLIAARTRNGGQPIRMVTEHGACVAGAGDPAATVHASRFELLRACSGRRTEAEIAAYGWDPAPDATLLLASDIFTMRTSSLDE